MDTFVPENGVQRITVGYDTAGFLALALESIDEAHEYHPLAPPGTYPPPPPPEWQFPGLAVGDLTRHRLIPDRVSNEFAGLVFLLWQLRADTTGFRYYVSTGLGPIEICIPDWRVIVVPDAHLPNQRISAWAGASALAPLIRATWEGLPEAARPVRVTVGYDRSGKPAAIIEDMPIPDGPPLPSLTDQAPPPWPVSTTAHRQIIRRLRSRPRELLVPLSDPFPPGTLNWSGQRPPRAKPTRTPDQGVPPRTFHSFASLQTSADLSDALVPAIAVEGSAQPPGSDLQRRDEARQIRSSRRVEQGQRGERVSFQIQNWDRHGLDRLLMATRVGCESVRLNIGLLCSRRHPPNASTSPPRLLLHSLNHRVRGKCQHCPPCGRGLRREAASRAR